MQCLVNTIQSYSAQDHPLNIILVGTHLDKLKEMEERSTQLNQMDADTHSQAAAPSSSQDPPPQFEILEEKDRLLREMLLSKSQRKTSIKVSKSAASYISVSFLSKTVIALLFFYSSAIIQESNNN